MARSLWDLVIVWIDCALCLDQFYITREASLWEKNSSMTSRTFICNPFKLKNCPSLRKNEKIPNALLTGDYCRDHLTNSTWSNVSLCVFCLFYCCESTYFGWVCVERSVFPLYWFSKALASFLWLTCPLHFRCYWQRNRQLWRNYNGKSVLLIAK